MKLSARLTEVIQERAWQPQRTPTTSLLGMAAKRARKLAPDTQAPSFN